MAPSNTRWVHVLKGDRSAWAPHTGFAVDERGTKALLAQQGLVLPGTSWKAVLEEVSALTEFPPRLLLERPGWTEHSFALPDGTVFSPDCAPKPTVTFEPDMSKCHSAGSLRGWLKNVAEPLEGQPLPMFLLMLAFAAPLLTLTGRSENFGFEIVGRKGCGKSTVQRLMASVLGGVANDEEGKYWIAFDSTLDGLEMEMEQHHGLPMIIDEANLFYAHEQGRSRGTKLKAVAFRLAQGHDKRRFLSRKPRSHRFVYVTSSNESLANMMSGEASGVSGAATDRLMTLNIGEQRQYGVFDTVPERYCGAEAYAKSLDQAARENHGYAIRAFLTQLVTDRAEDEKALRHLISEDMERFRERARVGHDDGSVGRVADAFALAYAAGQMAKRYRVLPRSFRCGPAALNCYEQLFSGPKPPPSFDALMAKVLQQPSVRNLDAVGLQSMSKRQVATIPVFLKTNRKGQREALFSPPTLEALIPGWIDLVSAPGTRCVHDHDARRLTKKREIRRGYEDRVVCIVLPPSEHGTGLEE